MRLSQKPASTRRRSMISQRKIDANRRNAKKSTGPRTEEGKDRVKLNALKHGLTARTVVLPHEDEEAYQQRLEAWSKDLNPRGDVAAYLVERAVRISWQLDRADFHERARLAKRIVKGSGNRKAARESAVEELIGRLLDPDDPGQADTAASARKRSSPRRKPERETRDDPRELIRKLESSAEGCRRLLAEWGRLLESVDGWIGPDGATCDEMVPRRRLLRLFGFGEDGTEDPAGLDPSLLLILKVQDLAEGEFCRRLLRVGRDDEDAEDPDEDYREEPLAHETGTPEPESESPWPPGPVADPAPPPSPELPRLKAEFRTMVAAEY